jgi:hypothetical protein
MAGILGLRFIERSGETTLDPPLAAVEGVFLISIGFLKGFFFSPTTLVWAATKQFKLNNNMVSVQKTSLSLLCTAEVFSCIFGSSWYGWVTL